MTEIEILRNSKLRSYNVWPFVEVTNWCRLYVSSISMFFWAVYVAIKSFLDKQIHVVYTDFTLLVIFFGFRIIPYICCMMFIMCGNSQNYSKPSYSSCVYKYITTSEYMPYIFTILNQYDASLIYTVAQYGLNIFLQTNSFGMFPYFF